MQKWEYDWWEVFPEGRLDVVDIKKLNKRLSDTGEEGWELVSVVSNGRGGYA